jgi:hypothetical protein
VTVRRTCAIVPTLIATDDNQFGVCVAVLVTHYDTANGRLVSRARSIGRAFRKNFRGCKLRESAMKVIFVRIGDNDDLGDIALVRTE